MHVRVRTALFFSFNLYYIYRGCGGVDYSRTFVVYSRTFGVYSRTFGVYSRTFGD